MEHIKPNWRWFDAVSLSGLLISEVVYRNAFERVTPLSSFEKRELGRLKTAYINGRLSLRQTLFSLFFELLGHDSQSPNWVWGASAKEFKTAVPEYEITLTPDMVLRDERNHKPLFVVWSVDSEKGLDALPDKNKGWRASAQRQFETLLAQLRCPLGLLTDGRSFRLFFRQEGASPSSITWDSEAFFEDTVAFEAFRNLLGTQTLLPSKEIGLFKLIRESQESQAELTSELGAQVYEVVQMLLDAVNENPSPIVSDRLYEILVKIAMRIVFILFAEENQLLPHGIPEYDEAYGIIHLANALEHTIYEVGEEQFKNDYAYRGDAWSQLRSLFRLIYEGSGHPRLPLVAHGGDLFDPKSTSEVEAVLKIDTVRLRQILRQLLYIQSPQGAYRLSYASIRVQQIGYVYEGLLEHSLIYQDGAYRFSASKLRKSSGTFYTPKALTSWLVEKTLYPLCYQGEAEGTPIPKPAEEILSLKVVDPAMGSGAFLVEAMDYIGTALLKSWERLGAHRELDEPARLNLAHRMIAEHCLYGVDINPMAVELAKMALWLATFSRDRPFSFLDHRLKCGNSLLGVGLPEVDITTIPNEVWAPIPEDSAEWKRAKKAAKDRNTKFFKKTQNGIQSDMFSFAGLLRQESRRTRSLLAKNLEKLSFSGEEKADYFSKEREYERTYLSNEDYRREKARLDLWLSQWFLSEEDGLPPLDNSGLQELYKTIAQTPMAEVPQTDEQKGAYLLQAQRTAQENRFFHWELEFPEVFEKGGFDAVIGNPPWETMILNEREFFADKSEEIHTTKKTDERERKIQELKTTNPDLWGAYRLRLGSIAQSNRYLSEREVFQSVSGGTPNTYAYFSALFLGLKTTKGRAGLLCPTGIATDASYARFFRSVTENGNLESLSDFVNGNIFQQVHASYRFSLVVFGSSDKVHARFALRDPKELCQKEPVVFSIRDLALFNPNTGTIPTFTDARDAEILLKVYRRHPILLREKEGKPIDNPYGITVFTQFHMSNDSKHFVRGEALEREGYRWEGGRYLGEEDGISKRFIPLFEGKSFSILDARYNAITPEGKGIACTEDEKQSPDFFPHVRYYVAEETVREDYRKRGITSPVVLGFRNITNITNMRTMIVSPFSIVAFGNSVQLIFSVGSHYDRLLPLSSSHFFDYFLRSKMQGVNLSYFILYQLPVISPERFEEKGPDGYATIREYLVSRLIPCLKDNGAFEPYLRELGYAGPMGGWNERERLRAMAEIDAVIAKLYGLDRDDITYIFTTFPIERQQQEKRYGAYLSRDLALEAFEKL